jgi:FtsP/CotA-like multicopper oxidase with cupredoxin domain
MNRREFLQLAGVSALSGASMFSGCAPLADRSAGTRLSAAREIGDAAHFLLNIAPVKVELAPKQIVQTIGYNGSAPGPLLRVKEGQRVVVNVKNDSDVAELVHWHGLYVPSEVDGATEEGTPMVPAAGSHEYSFTGAAERSSLVSHPRVCRQ